MRRPIKLFAALVAVIAIAVGLWFFLPAGWGGYGGAKLVESTGQPQPSSRVSNGQGQSGAPRGPVPVLAATAKAEDFPIVVRGIGNVAAFNEVAVKSRVDGNITKIMYREGQVVRAGDPLVQIDPRPYQAQLDQVRANQAKDEANLENARRDLARVAALLQTQLAATRQQYETQQALVAQLEATVKPIRRRWKPRN